jgi:hypothetical protein
MSFSIVFFFCRNWIVNGHGCSACVQFHADCGVCMKVEAKQAEWEARDCQESSQLARESTQPTVLEL